MSNVKNAKYRVKNGEGVYEVIHFETGMEQVQGLGETVEGINTEVATKAVKSEVEAGFQSVGAEIDAVEAVATGLDTRLTQAEKDIVKEVSDREAAITGVQDEVSTVAADLASEVTRATGAEKALEDRIAAVEGEVGTDLGDLRDVVAANTTAIAKEVADRKGEITRVEGLVSAEKERAEGVEAGLQTAINTKVAQADFDKEVIRVNGELDKKADKTQVATDIAAAVNVEKERALAAEGVLQANVNKVGSDLAQEVERAKGEEARIEGLAKTAQDEVDALEVVVEQNKTDINKKVEDYIQSNDATVNGLAAIITNNKSRLDSVEPKVSSLEGTVATHSTEIADLKAAVSDKNSNTLVFATMEEFHAAQLSPKVGDLAFVLDAKKAFIFKGGDAQGLELPTPPQGWVYFDEISTEVDLKDYAKTEEVVSKINAAVSDLTEIDTALMGGLEAEIARAKAAEKVNADAIIAEGNRAQEAEKVNADAIVSLGDAVKNVYTKAQADAMVDDAIKDQMTVVGSTQPSGKNAGHVWLEI